MSTLQGNNRQPHTGFPPPREMAPGPAPQDPVLTGYFRTRWQSWDTTERTHFLRGLGRSAQGSVPWIEPAPDGSLTHRAVTFFHQGEHTTAVILSANSLLNHHQVGSSEFEKMEDSTLWALTYLMPVDWEAAYRITVHTGAGPAPWRTETARRPIRLAADAGGPDPLNPVTGAGMNGGANSVVRLPGAPASPWLATATPDAQAGSPAMGGGAETGSRCLSAAGLERLEIPDSGNGRLRTIWVYAPPKVRPTESTPLLMLHDGQVWAKYLNLKSTLDAAIRAGVIPALHVAMIDSLDVETRSAELSGPTGTVDFVAHDLLPLLRRSLPVSHDAAGTIISGASYGGLASLWQVIRYPQLVGVALAQSPSLWRYDLMAPLEKVIDRVTVRMQAGIYEPEIHEEALKLRNQLASHGADIRFRSITGGHDWAWWNPWLVHGLSELLAQD
ncbi:MAG: alpha/beta hydrolase-fold protein [Micrococcaceae bacterium]|nr:alpha/beta hydrolase-fold protein [Micrococcaceae bacterium]